MRAESKLEMDRKKREAILQRVLEEDEDDVDMKEVRQRRQCFCSYTFVCACLPRVVYVPVVFTCSFEADVS